jgi:hypothetical protein
MSVQLVSFELSNIIELDEHHLTEGPANERQSHEPVTLNISGDFTSHTQHTHELFLDHLDTGLALLQMTDPPSYA